jgi:hypothetical protein
VAATRNDARLWAELAGLFHDAGCGTEDRLRFARKAVAIVRRERGDGPTYAPGDDVPLTVMTVFDVDGAVWDRQSADPASGLAPLWKMREFDPAEHESLAGGALHTDVLLGSYGPVTDAPEPVSLESERSQIEEARALAARWRLRWDAPHGRGHGPNARFQPSIGPSKKELVGHIRNLLAILDRVVPQGGDRG